MIIRHSRDPLISLLFFITYFVFASAVDACRAEAGADDFVQRFKIAKDGGEVTIPIRWNDRTLHFLVDTGSARTALDTRFRNILGAPIGQQKISRPIGEELVDVFRVPELRIGSTPLPIDRIIVLDFAQSRRRSGTQVDGLVGIDFLKHFVVCIDFEAGALELRKAIATGFSDHSERLYIELGAPRIILSIPGLGSESFTLDTGAGNVSCLMPADNVRQLEDQGAFRQVASTVVYQDSKTLPTKFGYLRELALAGQLHQNVGCATAGGNYIGRNLLAQYRVTFDFPNRKVYFAPRKSPLALDRPDASGVRLVRESRGTVIDYVSATSEAAKLGIEAGDVLLKIDGKSADELAVFTIREFLKQDGRTITLTIKHGDQVRDVTLPLKYRIPYPPDWPVRATKRVVKPIPADP